MDVSGVHRHLSRLAALAIATGLASACISDSRPSAAAASSTATSTTTVGLPPTSPVTTTDTREPTVQAGPTPEDLVRSLQTQPFAQPTISDHLHVDGVGPFAYADAGPQGRIDSAEVHIQSDVDGEQITAVYDVFPNVKAATITYDGADNNFRSFQGSNDPSYRTVTLSPSVPAFCASHPDGSTQCWLVHDVTTGTFNLTVPGGDTGTEDQAILQALLDHLISLGG